MEERSCHYKVSRAQFVLINRVVVYTRSFTISLRRSFLGMPIFVIRFIIVRKLAPPGLHFGPCGVYLKKHYISLVVGL